MSDAVLLSVAALTLLVLAIELREWKPKKNKVWLIVAFALLLRLTLPQEILGIDEIHQVKIVKNLMETKFGEFSTGPWPPGLHILALPLAVLLNNSWLALKIVNIILSSLSVYLVYVLAKELKNETAGLAGAVMLAILPVHIKFAGMAFLETASVFFLLLSFILYFKKHVAFPLALSYFVFTRPENYLVALVFLVVAHKQIIKDSKNPYWIFLFLSILICAFLSVSYGPNDEYWNLSYYNATKLFIEKVKGNLFYFFNLRQFSPVVSIFAIFNLKKKKEILLPLLFLFGLYTSYHFGIFTSFESLARFSLTISVLIVCLASLFFDSKKKLALLSLVLLSFPFTLQFIQSSSPVSEALEIIKSDTKLQTTELKIYSVASSLFEMVYPDKARSGEPSHTSFILSQEDFVTNSMNPEPYLLECETLTVWNYNLSYNKHLNFYEFDCS
ncbi:MAG: hypothetical protein GOU99_02500 [Candidatus Altiarchaeota archaeon]|nr:hypothetical protein [Candidatus Altiarchaeota archaeon]